MNFEMVRDYLIKKPYTTEDFPFDETTLVFRVGNKIYALMGLNDEPPRINLKCNPQRALELRESYNCVIPGYHMNKKHWNTVVMDEDLSWELLRELMDHSYDLIFKSLPKKTKLALEENL